jgi:hypothetical protein
MSAEEQHSTGPAMMGHHPVTMQPMIQMQPMGQPMMMQQPMGQPMMMQQPMGQPMMMQQPMGQPMMAQAVPQEIHAALSTSIVDAADKQKLNQLLDKKLDLFSHEFMVEAEKDPGFHALFALELTSRIYWTGIFPLSVR